MTRKPHKDVRVAATSNIWGMTVGILAICIPLSVVTRSGPILPLAAIGGAMFSTIAVWRSDDKKPSSPSLSEKNFATLEQRIANLETIVSSDDWELYKKIQQLESSDISSLPTQSAITEKKLKKH